MEENWENVFQHVVNGTTPFTLYHSKHSKLRVAIGDVPGPLVRGVFSFITAATTEDGLPKAVSKLVYMGSEKYPYRNILRDTQHLTFLKEFKATINDESTEYSYTTVGTEGFMKLLPIQMDSLFNPLLREDDYATEIHHLNKRGDDKGKLYEEQKAKEYAMRSIVQRKYKETVYPNGTSYRYDPAGRMENIRTSLNLQKIKEFHKQFYHLNNLIITVCGIVDHQQVLKAISEIEKPLISKIPPTFVRPKYSKEPAITKSTVQEIECPSKDEDSGVVALFWNMPEATESFKFFGVWFVCQYMQAILSTAFEALGCEVKIEYNFIGRNEICFLICGKPFEMLADFQKTFKEFAEGIISGAEEFFKPEMFNQALRSGVAKLEEDMLEVLPDYVNEHQKMDAGFEDLKKMLNFADTLRKALKGSLTSWKKLTSTCFGGENIQVVAKPSKKLARDITTQEKERLKKQRDLLGENGKKECEEKMARIEKEIAEKKVLKNAELCKALTVDNINDIKMHEVVRCSNVEEECADEICENHPEMKKFVNSMAFTTHLHCVPTNFIQVIIFIDSSKLENKDWLLLLLDQVFTSPAEVGNIEMTAEYVEQMVSGELESLDVQPSIVNPFIELRMKTTYENWSEMRKLAELYYTGTLFDGKRIVEGAGRLIQKADEAVKNGESVCKTLLYGSVYERAEAPLAQICDPIYLKEFHKYVQERGSQKPAWAADQLERLRTSLIKADIDMHIVCSEEHIPVFEEWDFLKCSGKNKFTALPLPPLRQDKTCKHFAGEGIKNQMMKQVSEVTAEEVRNNLPEILLLIDYMNEKIAQQMRMEGLAEVSKLSYNYETQWIELLIQNTYKVQFAHYRTIQVIRGILDAEKMEEAELKKCSRKFSRDLFTIVGNMQEAIEWSLYAPFRNLKPDYLKSLAAKAMRITSSELFEKGAPVLQRFVDSYDSRKPDQCYGTPVAVVPKEKNREMECYFRGKGVTVEQLHRPRPAQ